MESDNKCGKCSKVAALRCSRCHATYYCTKKCQKEDWKNHKVNCAPPLVEGGRVPRTLKKTNTAVNLVKAVFGDEFPKDPETLADFGFSQCTSIEEERNLLGLYIGLVKMLKVDAVVLHKWQQANELAQRIRETYEDAGANSHYFQWFLKNQHLLDAHAQTLNPLAIVRKYLSSKDKDIDDLSQLEPEEKRKSVGLYFVLLYGTIPRIEMDMWVDFGFCSCKDSEMETKMGLVYRTLIDKCTLEEFYTNFKANSLPTLLRSKNIFGIDEYESLGVIFGRPSKSVYLLKQYVLAENVPLALPAEVDYGFFHCRNKAERQKLRKIYQKLFQHKEFDIIRLHEACITGKLYEYASQYVEAEARLMRNPYPLPALDS